MAIIGIRETRLNELKEAAADRDRLRARVTELEAALGSINEQAISAYNACSGWAVTDPADALWNISEWAEAALGGRDE